MKAVKQRALSFNSDWLPVLKQGIISTASADYYEDDENGLEDKDAALAFIKRYKEAYKTDTVKSYIPGDRIVRQWVILAARQYHLMPTTDEPFSRPYAEPPAQPIRSSLARERG